MKRFSIPMVLFVTTLMWGVYAYAQQEAQTTPPNNDKTNTCVDESSASYKLYTESSNLVKDGEKSLLSGNYEAAKTCFEKAIKAYPENLDAKVKLAWVLALMGKSNEAIKIVDPLLAQNDSWPAALLVKAVALSAKNDEKGANETFEKLFSAEPDELRHYLFYARYTMKFGLSKAAKRLEDAFAKHKDWYEIAARAGWLYYADGNYQKAYELLLSSLPHIEKPQGYVLPFIVSATKSNNAANAKKVLTPLSNNKPWAMAALGAIEYQNGNKAEGKKLIETAAEKCKDIPAAMYFKGLILIDEGKNQAGADAIKAALSADPQQNIMLFYMAGEALEKVSNKDFALDAYKRFCNLTQNMGILPKLRKQAKERMNKLFASKK